MDKLDLVPGKPWERQIEDALDQSARVVVILSPAAVASDNVRDEVNLALREKKTLIPIICRDCRVPMRLDRLQRVDFTQDYAGALKGLLKTLDLKHGNGQDEPTIPTPKRTNITKLFHIGRNRTLTVGAGLILLAALGAFVTTFPQLIKHKLPPLPFSGQVRDESDQPVPNAHLSVYENQAVVVASTDDHGMFVIQLSPVAQYIKINVEAEGYDPLTLEVDPRMVGVEQIRLRHHVAPISQKRDLPSKGGRQLSLPQAGRQRTK